MKVQVGITEYLADDLKIEFCSLLLKECFQTKMIQPSAATLTK